MSTRDGLKYNYLSFFWKIAQSENQIVNSQGQYWWTCDTFIPNCDSQQKTTEISSYTYGSVENSLKNHQTPGLASPTSCQPWW